jgi:hypothetical protein
MKMLFLAVAIAMPAVALAQMTSPSASDNATGSGQGMAPEATPPSASQVNPQTNPGTPSATPSGTSTGKMKHHHGSEASTSSQGSMDKSADGGSTPPSSTPR